MPGRADLNERSDHTKLATAIATLAKFHTALNAGSKYDFSAGIRLRHSMTISLLEGQVQLLKRAVASHKQHVLQLKCSTLIDLVAPQLSRLEHELGFASQIEVETQTCIRDIWHDHFLFTDDRVTGLIDFGAMRTDTVAADLARLLGSLGWLAREDWEGWLDAYAHHRPLSPTERRFVNLFHHANCLLSGLNWARWLFEESRRFEDLSRVEQRLDHIYRGALEVTANARWDY